MTTLPVPWCRSTTAIWQTSCARSPDDEAVLDAAGVRSSARVGAWFSTTPMTRAVTAFLPAGAAISKSSGTIVRPTFTVPRGEVRIGPGRDVVDEHAVLGQHHAVRDHHLDRQRREVGGEDEVGAAARRDRAELALEAEMRSRC